MDSRRLHGSPQGSQRSLARNRRIPSALTVSGAISTHRRCPHWVRNGSTRSLGWAQAPWARCPSSTRPSRCSNRHWPCRSQMSSTMARPPRRRPCSAIQRLALSNTPIATRHWIARGRSLTNPQAMAPPCTTANRATNWRDAPRRMNKPFVVFFDTRGWQPH